MFHEFSVTFFPGILRAFVLKCDIALFYKSVFQILQNVLQYLPHSDLKRCRLVNYTFNDEARRILKKNSKIVLNSSKRLVAFFLEKFNGVSWFCECIQLVNVHVLSPTMKMVFENIGSDMKSLDLRDSKWSCSELEDIVTTTMPALRELAIHGPLPKLPTKILDGSRKRLPLIKTLNLQLFEKGLDEDFLNQFAKDILSATPNLEILRSRDTGKFRNRREKFHRILFETLIDTELNLRFPYLRRMDFSVSPWSDDQIKRLAGKRYPLSYLNLTILPEISMGALKALLISVRQTLLKLKLSFTYWRKTELPCDMHLDKLQHLSLDWFTGSLQFVSRLKSLQALILAQVDLNELFTVQEAENFAEPLQHLSRLEVYQHSEAAVLPKTVDIMADAFPSVRKLVLGKLTNESMRTVFTRFPEVEEFSAIEGLYTDSGVTGIEFDYCEGTDRKHVSEICRGNLGYYNESLIDRQRTFPYLGDLKCKICLINIRSCRNLDLSPSVLIGFIFNYRHSETRDKIATPY
jgi:hypothetical protein